MISNSQGVSAANGHAVSGQGIDPTDVRDAAQPGLFRFLAAIQVR